MILNLIILHSFRLHLKGAPSGSRHKQINELTDLETGVVTNLWTSWCFLNLSPGLTGRPLKQAAVQINFKPFTLHTHVSPTFYLYELFYTLRYECKKVVVAVLYEQWQNISVRWWNVVNNTVRSVLIWCDGWNQAWSVPPHLCLLINSFDCQLGRIKGTNKEPVWKWCRGPKHKHIKRTMSRRREPSPLLSLSKPTPVVGHSLLYLIENNDTESACCPLWQPVKTSWWGGGGANTRSIKA